MASDVEENGNQPHVSKPNDGNGASTAGNNDPFRNVTKRDNFSEAIQMKMNIVSLRIQCIEDNLASITSAMAAEEDLQQLKRITTILINS